MAQFEYIKSLVGMYLPEATEGQGMVEYGLILVLVSVVAIVALQIVGTNVTAVFNSVAGSLAL